MRTAPTRYHLLALNPAASVCYPPKLVEGPPEMVDALLPALSERCQNAGHPGYAAVEIGKFAEDLYDALCEHLGAPTAGTFESLVNWARNEGRPLPPTLTYWQTAYGIRHTAAHPNELRITYEEIEEMLRICSGAFRTTAELLGADFVSVFEHTQKSDRSLLMATTLISRVDARALGAGREALEALAGRVLAGDRGMEFLAHKSDKQALEFVAKGFAKRRQAGQGHLLELASQLHDLSEGALAEDLRQWLAVNRRSGRGHARRIRTVWLRLDHDGDDVLFHSAKVLWPEHEADGLESLVFDRPLREPRDYIALAKKVANRLRAAPRVDYVLQLSVASEEAATPYETYSHRDRVLGTYFRCLVVQPVPEEEPERTELRKPAILPPAPDANVRVVTCLDEARAAGPDPDIKCVIALPSAAGCPEEICALLERAEGCVATFFLGEGGHEALFEGRDARPLGEIFDAVTRIRNNATTRVTAAWDDRTYIPWEAVEL